jgi:hypothetical protein
MGGTVGSAALLGIIVDKPSVALSQSLQDSTSVSLREMDHGLTIENGRVQVRLSKSAGGVNQDYSARNSEGEWRLLVSSFRPPELRPVGTAPLYGDQPEGREFRLLTASIVDQITVLKRDPNQAVVELSGVLPSGTKLRQTISLEHDDRHFHIEVTSDLASTPPRLEYLLSTFAFEGGNSPDFTHVPCMKRAADDVIGDRIFNAPAALVQEGQLFAALLPDLDKLNSEVVNAKDARPVEGFRGFRVPQDLDKISFPAILDMDLLSGMTTKPIFSFGFADFITEQHVYWRHDNHSGSMVRVLSGKHLRYGFDLLLAADAPRYRGYQGATQFIWKRYGSQYLKKPRPQVMPLEEYAKVCLPAAFAYRGDISADTDRYSDKVAYDAEKSGPLPTWLEFEIDGQPVGGIRATPAQWYYDIQYSSWWNNARDAVALYSWGQRLNDNQLVEKARRMVNLALCAPQNRGIFPSTYRYNEKRWVGCYWKFPEGFDVDWNFPEKWEPGAMPKFWDFNSDNYMTSAASLTGSHLLRYRRLCQDDTRIVPYLSKYADFLLDRMNADGSVPAWFSADLKPSKSLSFNSDGGVHIWFLTELFEATQKKRYLDAAERMANFLTQQVLPHQRWFDFETFYSCAEKPENVFDRRTGQGPQCTASMMWALHGLTALAKTTGDRGHLAAAEAVADYASFFQASWQPHFITTAYAFGGFRSQNSDAEWLDMRSSAFGEGFAALAELTHRQDLYERAVAAMHSAFAVIDHPRIVENAVFQYPRYPVGIEPENIDHEGLPQVPLRSGFDWGEGGALAGAAELQRVLGGIFIDAKHHVAVGIDGVEIKDYAVDVRTIRLNFRNQLAELPFPWKEPYFADLRIVGLEKGEYQLVVNGGPPRTVTDADLQRFPLRIEGA